jgi:hypothetical protein
MMAANATSFQRGNLAALKYGTRSALVRETTRKALLEEMRELVDRALGESRPADDLLRDLLADALADVRMLRDYLTRMGGPISPKGKVYNAVHVRRVREHDAVALMRELGVGPKARSTILGGAAQTEGLATQLARARLQQARPVTGPQNGRAAEAFGLGVLPGGTNIRSTAPGASGGHGGASHD